MDIEQRIILPPDLPEGLTIRKGITIEPQPQRSVESDKDSVTTTTTSDGITETVRVCDGSLEIGPVKTCLNEFSAVQSIGIVAAIAFLIILWRKLK